jgi:hypothetical protein
MLQNLDEPGQQREATQSWTVLLLPGNRLSRFTGEWCIPYCGREESRKALKSFGLLCAHHRIYLSGIGATSRAFC